MSPNPSDSAAETDSPQRQTPDALLLHGFWYRALPGDRVGRLAMEKAQLLGLRVLLSRLEVRLPIGTMRGDSVAHQRTRQEAARGSHLCWQPCLRRTRRLYL